MDRTQHCPVYQYVTVFKNGVVTRFLSIRAELKIGSACAWRGRQGDATGLEYFARHAGSLAAKDAALSADRDLHLNQVVQIPEHVGFQFPLLAH